MGFEALLGNDRLKETLAASLHRGHISHFYLISGPKGSGKHTLAKLLAQAILCQGGSKPCGVCGPCRKIESGNHPDFITVEDPEHKNVAVKIVRQIREDVFIWPNESAYKIYLFPQELGTEGQNALLKILEEPPKHGVFILLADNPEKLLTTVRSRCTELRLQALPESVLRPALEQAFPQADAQSIAAAISRSGGYLGQAKALLTDGSAASPQTELFAKSFSGRDTLGLLQLLTEMERWKRDQALPEWQAWLQLLESALADKTGHQTAAPLARLLSGNRSAAELMQAINDLQKIIEYAQGNVSVAAICGYLQWALR